ncbi:MAG: putative dehydrogenase, partial [Frankiales bacterium]|nr:putative dehydrogenase [Frankiales bacterium]
VTCPTMRYHPAVIAQQAATVQLLSGGRFSLGLGAGENLNEHVVGHGWPPADIRHDMLREAVEILRALWDGGWTNYRGQYFEVESAKVFDLPDQLPPVGIAGSGTQSATLAAELGDFLIGTEPKPELREAYVAAGGTGEQVGQFPVVFGPDATQARQLLRDQFRWAALGWKVQAELPGPPGFEAASQFVRPEDMADVGVWGPDPDPYLATLTRFRDAGYGKVALVQVGPDQDQFSRWFTEVLQPLVAGI